MRFNRDRFTGKTSAGHNPLVQGVLDGVIGGIAFTWAAPTRGRVVSDKIERYPNPSEVDHNFPNRGIDYYELMNWPNLHASAANYYAESTFLAAAATTVVAQAGLLAKVGGPVALAAPLLTNAVSGLYEAARNNLKQGSIS